MFGKWKSVVGQTALATTAGSSTGAAAQKGLSAILSEARKLGEKIFDEREWQCPCGHKFRAAGDWVACAPVHCEVSNCPNPKYYIDGPGRALLEANPSGVKLQQVTTSHGQQQPQIEAKNSMASRFKK